MENAAEEPEKEEEASEAGDESEKKSGGKKKLIIIIAAAVLILLLVPVGLHFSGVMPLFGGSDEHAEGDDEHSEESDDGESDGHGDTEGKTVSSGPVHFELDEFLVNLNTSGNQSRFLKMSIQLELNSEEDKIAIESYVPRIRDSLQIYLRELRAEDLRGSAATYRLKEELMLRLTKTVYPIPINDILFKDFIIQ